MVERIAVAVAGGKSGRNSVSPTAAGATKTGVSAHVFDAGFVEHFLLPYRAMQERLSSERKITKPGLKACASTR